ncbi:MAG: ABC transporter permease [bacterium]|nr:ABC transporter permease [bacterium]MDE0438388.1 ABC transporter permease [bacterium]
MRFTAMQARVGVLILLCVFFTIRSPFFFTSTNLVNVLVNGAVIGIIGSAMTLLLVARQVDVSVGSAIGFAGAVFAVFARDYGLEWGVVGAIGAAMAIAAINAVAIIKFRVNSILTTLATLVAFRGASKVVMDGRAVRIEGFRFLGRTRFEVWGIEVPVAVIVLLLVVAIFYVIMRLTKYGQHMYAIGANPQAARLAGIPLERQVGIAFVLTGATVALASMIVVSQVGAVSPTTGERMEFLALTGVIVGGASLYGGRGSVIGTLVAILILAVLDNGLVLLQVQSFWQEVSRGVLLLGAVIFDQLGRREAEVRMEV